jgi:hypothetical protein
MRPRSRPGPAGGQGDRCANRSAFARELVIAGRRGAEAVVDSRFGAEFVRFLFDLTHLLLEKKWAGVEQRDCLSGGRWQDRMFGGY